MASRREQKESARQARIAAERAAAAARAGRIRRLGMVGGVVVVALIVAAVAVVISTSSAQTGGIQTGAAATGTEAAIARELKGIPQHGTTLGQPTARVTIQYFGDLECPYCAELTLGAGGGGLPRLITGPVRRGQIKLVYRSMETATHGFNADRWVPQQVAAYAAGSQDLFWNYAELFYHEQGDETSHYVTETYLQGLARQIPTLHFQPWMTARRNPALAAAVAADGKRAQSYGLAGTPTLVVTGAKGSALVPTNASGVEAYAAIMSTVGSVS